MSQAQDYAKAHETDAGGIFRLVGIAFRRYAREPSSRPASAKLILTSAVALYARETSVGEASVAVAEVVAELAQAERSTKRGTG